jgi:hypothetical protein
LTIAITFHQDVIATRDDFSLQRADDTEVDFDLAYDPATYTARLVSREFLGQGRLKLIVGDTVVSGSAGLALDGEIVAGPLALPSGDGVAGGDAVVEFVPIVARRPTARRVPGGTKTLKRGIQRQ